MFPGLHVRGELETTVCFSMESKSIFGDATFEILGWFWRIKIDVSVGIRVSLDLFEKISEWRRVIGVAVVRRHCR